MRRVTRSLFVVVLAAFAFGVYAGPREPRQGLVPKIVKKIKALGDGITIPVPAPKP